MKLSCILPFSKIYNWQRPLLDRVITCVFQETELIGNEVSAQRQQQPQFRKLSRMWYFGCNFVPVLALPLSDCWRLLCAAPYAQVLKVPMFYRIRSITLLTSFAQILIYCFSVYIFWFSKTILVVFFLFLATMRFLTNLNLWIFNVETESIIVHSLLQLSCKHLQWQQTAEYDERSVTRSRVSVGAMGVPAPTIFWESPFILLDF